MHSAARVVVVHVGMSKPFITLSLSFLDYLFSA